MKPLTIAEIEYVAHDLARKLMAWDESIPDFCTRYPNILERCLVAPFQAFGGKTLYKGLVGKTSILFYLMIKNHPFQNGNKRVAVMTLLCFLHKNKKWLKVDEVELYNFARWVAESNPKVKEATVEAIEKFTKTYLVNL
ncbi:MAG: Death-on-curing protein [Parcubacteria group bacterium GW2011_GWB1_41_6]|nr:MAG: Death-on-curing protein [Parcubacteria group bacterium GW2011_GWB1_41_6]KKS34508.1 MAG: Death-on-curing protein [Parcubacteria group bacterium GW2011_GWC2_42_13]KKS57895.1 MAG: Death-on-curing protein [Parcubacteria group bacterium GW2011_GWA2_42_35]